MSDTTFYSSVNPICEPQLRAAPAQSPWSNLYTYAHTKLDEYHTSIRELLPAERIFLLQRSC